jgi:hypothetical protein
MIHPQPTTALLVLHSHEQSPPRNATHGLPPNASPGPPPNARRGLLRALLRGARARRAKQARRAIQTRAESGAAEVPTARALTAEVPTARVLTAGVLTAEVPTAESVSLPAHGGGQSSRVRSGLGGLVEQA